MLNATVGVQRAIARLRPDTTSAQAASRTHRSSLRAARAVQAHLIVPHRARSYRALLAIAARALHPGFTAERALPIGIATLVALASAASFLPSTSDAIGGPIGDGAPIRIAVGGAFGLDGTGQGLGATIDNGAPTLDVEPGHTLDFRPLVLDSLDRIPDPVQPITAPATSTVTGPFLADGTLVAGFAPDTTIEDGSALVRSYRVKSGDTLVGIAAKYRISMMTLWWANDLKNKNALHIGQVLRIPPVSGLVIEVGETDTLASVASRYGVEGQSILDANGLVDPNLVIGQTLVIPGGRGDQIATPKPRARPVAKPRPRTTARTTTRPAYRPPTTYNGGSMLWPVIGGGNYISQYFHYGHYGLDIAADAGSKARAAASGTVIFAGWKSNGGGYQVWIAHGSNLYTTYNHMSSVSVGDGEHVSRGDQVGRVGCTGNCTGPHLHFEVWIGPVWNGGYRVNPLRYL